MSPLVPLGHANANWCENRVSMSPRARGSGRGTPWPTVGAKLSRTKGPYFFSSMTRSRWCEVEGLFGVSSGGV